MNLVPNWRHVISHAWSMWLIAIAFVLEAIEVALPFFSDAFPTGVVLRHRFDRLRRRAAQPSNLPRVAAADDQEVVP